MASTEISSTAVVAALQLTTEKAKELFFHLKVPLKILDDIDTNHVGSMRKIHYVQVWFDHDVGASWEKIVAGLRLIGMKALAQTLATQQCLGGSSTSAVVTLAPNFTSSSAMAAKAPGASGPQTSGSSYSDPSLSPMASPSSPLSPSDRVSQVRAEIDQLSDTFSDLMSDTSDEMCARENKDPQFLKTFRCRLLDLPVSKKVPHAKFFCESEDDFLMARNMEKTFAILRRYCSYISQL